MLAYQSTLLGRTEVAQDTMAFRFEKPRSFLFKAGQYIDLTLLGSEPGGSNGLTHTFSIACSPSAEELVVATRMRGTVFKRALFRSAHRSGGQGRGPNGLIYSS